jgi:flagellar biosynthesis/type III secretory pathway M-ring protein FliF/YscJ
MKDYEILLVYLAVIGIILFIILRIFFKPVRPIETLQVEQSNKEAQLLAREQIRRKKEIERKAEEKRQLKEKLEINRNEERLSEEANKRELAEAALLEGKDVCLNCYTIEPRRCYCGHCTACYGYCYICDD